MPTPIVYPDLPVPQTAPIRSVERRVLSQEASGPFEARAVQRDRLAMMQVTFPPMIPAQMAIWLDWWRITLTRGGAWFYAPWPLPWGTGGVFRFIGAPKREYVPKPGGIWRVSALVEVRGRGLDPVIYPKPLLAMHFDNNWTDLSGHPITSVHWGFGHVPSEFTDSDQQFGSAAYYNVSTEVEPLLSDNRGSLDLNLYGEWQIKAFFSVRSTGTSNGALVSLFSPMTAAPVSGATGNATQFVLRMIRGGSGWYPDFIYASIDPATGLPSGEVLVPWDDPAGPMPEFNYDENYFIAIVADATSIRLYINEDLIADDRTASYPPGSRPMRYVDGSPFTNQYFAVGKLAAGGVGIDEWPNLSAWTAHWEGMIDDLHIARGIGAAEFTGQTIVVPTEAFKV